MRKWVVCLYLLARVPSRNGDRKKSLNSTRHLGHKPYGTGSDQGQINEIVTTVDPAIHSLKTITIIHSDNVAPTSLDPNQEALNEVSNDVVNATPSDDPLGDDEENSSSSVDYIEKSIPLSSLAWEAYELSSDWSKSLKGDHGILAALDLSLPLPMCNVDISSPTKPRDILDIFGDVIDLPQLNNFMDTRIDTTDDRTVFSQVSCHSPPVESLPCGINTAASVTTTLNDVALNGSSELDRSNTLMTPQELERMPDQGLEFEQSVGPKELPKLTSPGLSSSSYEGLDGDDDSVDMSAAELAESGFTFSSLSNHTEENKNPVVLKQDGHELTTITVVTSQGEKIFKVSTAQLKQAASLMQPVIINANAGGANTLIMLPVAKVKLVQPEQHVPPKYKCLYCGKIFPRSYKLRLHEMMKHTMERPFPCSYPGCKWAFSDYYRQKNHERCHLKLKEHKCPECGKGYSSFWNLRAHMNQLHNKDNQPYTCHKCGETFYAEAKLQKHTAEVHPEAPKQFKCEEEGCGEEFHSRLGLTRHMLGHEKRKALNLVCTYPDCGKTFKWKSRFDLHMRAHEGENMYKCTFQGCKASFLTMSGLNRHSKTHANNKQNVCKICSKAFNRVDHLRIHELSHSTERPYLCTEPGCDHASSSKSALSNHLKRHALKAERVLLICPDKNCKATFQHKHFLIKHVNADHPDIVELQYAKELEEIDLATATLDQKLVQACEQAERNKAVTAPTDETEAAWNNITYNVVGLPSRQPDPLAVVSTEVGGRLVELVLPTDCASQPTVAAGASHTGAGHREEKGSARTDSYVNSMMCVKARNRQARQKDMAAITEAVEAVASTVPSVHADIETLDQPVDGLSSTQSKEINTRDIMITLPNGTQSIISMPTASGSTTSNTEEVVANANEQLTTASDQIAASSISTSIPPSFDQWLLSGQDASTIIYHSTADLGTLETQMDADDNTDFNELYEGFEQMQ